MCLGFLVHIKCFRPFCIYSKCRKFEINEEFMKQKLYEFRGCKVLLDADLAEVYGYELKAFNQQVKRNIERFQDDMMFQLSDNEVGYLRSQFVTANISSKSRSNPFVFTEQGVFT